MPVDLTKLPSGATFINNITEWEARTIWNGIDYDHRIPAPEINYFLLIQAVGIVVLNGMIVVAAYRRGKILTNASNQLSVNICTSNTVYGLCMVGIRLALAIDFYWSEALCRFYEVSNVLLIATLIFSVTNMATERYLNIIRLKSMTRKQANQLTIGSLILGAADALLHAIGYRPVISSSGLFCFPSSMGSTIGIMDIFLLSSQCFSIAAVYIGIIRTLRKTSKKVTMSHTGGHSANGAHSGTAQGNSSSNDHAGSAASHANSPMVSPATAMPPPQSPALKSVKAMEKQMSGLRVATGAIDSPRSSGHLPEPPKSPLMPSPSESSSMINAKARPTQRSRDAEIQRRIVMRGICSLIGVLFTVAPIDYLIGKTVASGMRTDAVFDTCFLISKFCSELADPIILLTMDIRFRNAVWTTFFWWIPVKASPAATLNRSGAAL
ncbi:hypothetical protein H9P43_003915 [Blastocladiella emersonii ATCC 22665]|nr:hypothetical protein H9P43_003915 [Blastocladiella emersonii ATCC 22665]